MQYMMLWMAMTETKTTTNMKHIKLFEQFLNESDQNVWEPIENAPSPKAYKSRSGNYIINMTSKNRMEQLIK